MTNRMLTPSGKHLLQVRRENRALNYVSFVKSSKDIYKPKITKNIKKQKKKAKWYRWVKNSKERVKEDSSFNDDAISQEKEALPKFCTLCLFQDWNSNEDGIKGMRVFGNVLGVKYPFKLGPKLQTTEATINSTYQVAMMNSMRFRKDYKELQLTKILEKSPNFDVFTDSLRAFNQYDLGEVKGEESLLKLPLFKNDCFSS